MEKNKVGFRFYVLICQKYTVLTRNIKYKNKIEISFIIVLKRGGDHIRSRISSVGRALYLYKVTMLCKCHGFEPHIPHTFFYSFIVL